MPFNNTGNYNRRKVLYIGINSLFQTVGIVVLHYVEIDKRVRLANGSFENDYINTIRTICIWVSSFVLGRAQNTGINFIESCRRNEISAWIVADRQTASVVHLGG